MAINHVLQTADDAGFTTNLVEVTVVAPTSDSTESGDGPDKNRYGRVKAVDTVSGLESLWSNTVLVNTGPVPIFGNFARTNSLTGATFSASSSNGTQTPEFAFNDWRNVNGNYTDIAGNYGGSWWADFSDAGPPWLMCDLGVPRTIERIDVIGLQDDVNTTTEPDLTTTASTYILAAFKVQSSDDGSTWTDRESVTGNDKVWRQWTGLSITARYWRVLCITGSSGVRAVVSFELWGHEMPTAKRILHVQGDSEEAGAPLLGYTAPYFDVVAAAKPDWTIINDAVAGRPASTADSFAYSCLATLAFDPWAERNVSLIALGTNDIGGGTAHGTVYGYLSGYADKVKAAHIPDNAEIWIPTMLPATGYGDATNRANLDADIIANSYGADVVPRVDACGFNPATDSVGDSLHPTNSAAATKIAPVYEALM